MIQKGIVGPIDGNSSKSSTIHLTLWPKADHEFRFEMLDNQHDIKSRQRKLRATATNEMEADLKEFKQRNNAANLSHTTLQMKTLDIGYCSALQMTGEKRDVTSDRSSLPALFTQAVHHKALVLTVL